MSIQTRNDKKREILDHLEKQSSKLDITSLQKEELIDKFSDDHYTDESIYEILDELLDEEPIMEGTHSLTLLYPEKDQNKIEKVIDPSEQWPLAKIAIVGFYSFVAIVVMGDTSSLFMGANNEQVLWISFIGIVLTYGLGQIVRKIISIVEGQVPLIREYRYVLYPSVFILLTGSIAIGIYVYVTGENVPALAIATFLPGSIVAGVEIGKYIENRNSTEDDHSVQLQLGRDL